MERFDAFIHSIKYIVKSVWQFSWDARKYQQKRSTLSQTMFFSMRRRFFSFQFVVHVQQQEKSIKKLQWNAIKSLCNSYEINYFLFSFVRSLWSSAWSSFRLHAILSIISKNISAVEKNCKLIKTIIVIIARTHRSWRMTTFSRPLPSQESMCLHNSHNFSNVIVEMHDSKSNNL